MEDPEDQENAKPSLEETLFRLDLSYQAMMRENAVRDRFEAMLIAEAKALINEKYKHVLCNCSENAIVEIDNTICCSIGDMVLDIMKVFYKEE